MFGRFTVKTNRRKSSRCTGPRLTAREAAVSDEYGTDSEFARALNSLSTRFAKPTHYKLIAIDRQAACVTCRFHQLALRFR